MRTDTRWPADDADLYRRYAEELVALAPDVILASGSPSVAALQRVTRSVPIVFANVIDPVGAGFVTSLARPGGNTTGFSAFEYSLSGKWLDLLKEIAPNLTRVAVLRDPSYAAGIGQFAVIQSSASSSRVELSAIDTRDVGEIERALGALAQEPNGGVIIAATSSAVAHLELIISLTMRYRLPNVYAFSYYPARGALLRTDLIQSANSHAPLVMSIVSLRGRGPLTFRCRHPQSTNWSSISRPRKRSASRCRKRCCSAPTR